MRVSVVIASRNRPDRLEVALGAAVEAIGPDDEVVVVDSASDGRATLDVAAAAGVDAVRVDVPGVSVARNAGVAAASAPLVVFTDDDCRPGPGWTDAYVPAFEDPLVGFATGLVIGEGGTIAAVVPDTGEHTWTWPHDPHDIGAGANMAVRRQAYIDIGGLWAEMGPGARIPMGEEHDLFMRLMHQGWIGVRVREAVVGHNDLRSRTDTLGRFWVYGVGAGALCRRAEGLDRELAHRMLRERRWDRGARLVASHLARGWDGAALQAALMMVGTEYGYRRYRGIEINSSEARRPVGR